MLDGHSCCRNGDVASSATVFRGFPLWSYLTVIVLFGASSDIGQRLHTKLESAGLAVRKVSRRLPDGFKADLATSEGVSEALAGADKIVSCAHARYTKTILEACRPE